MSHYTQENLTGLRMHELVEIFNGMSDEPITEFRTKNQGVNRILAIQTEAMSQDAIIHSLPDTAVTTPLRNWTPERPTVAQRTRELLLKGLDDDEVWRILCREYTMTTGSGYVPWYRHGLEHGFKRTEEV